MNNRKQTLEEIHKELSYGLMGKDAYCRRVDNVFFRCGDSGCVQRDVVYYGSKRHKLNFELISLDWSYFTGSHQHALALKDAFGGKIYPSEYVSCSEAMDLWIWEGPERQQQMEESIHSVPHALDFETVKAALFDEA
ncbi:MAG: hypothetical protein J5896_01045 [Alphaproteobacteria bacterium]|nr:hypothetical protein [Alphaproteobacteria bacterium]